MRSCVIFTGSTSFSVAKGIVKLAFAYPDIDFKIFYHSPQRSLSTILRNQVRNVRRNGVRWIWYQASEILRALGDRGSQRRSMDDAPGGDYEWSSMLAMSNVSVHFEGNVNSDEAARRLRQDEPDFGISLAAPILRNGVFDIPRLGTINLHKGKLPDFRGMPPAFWEFFTGATEVGCTIHKVDAGLDTGDILLRRVVQISDNSTVRGMQLILDEIGVDMMIDAVAMHVRGEPYLPQEGGGTTFAKPTLAQVAQLEKSMATVSDDPAREKVKSLAFQGYVNLWRPIPRRVLGLVGKQKVIVLLYHRVSDEFRDGVTVGVEQFEQQMAHVRRKHLVVGIEDLLSGAFDRHSGRPIVAVTFDDGYLDNYERAFPILERHRIPTTFFVSTGKISSDVGFDHDLKKLERPVATMNWEQLSEMKDAGFSIGSHTVSHIDCGTAPMQVVEQELMDSRETLRRELDIPGDLFAYPFGGRANITPAVVELVKKMGFRCCMSAFGGINSGQIDPFAILRIGISHNFSKHAFLARLEGYS